MAKVFICYRRVDSGDAGRLQAHLRHVPGIELQFDINTIHAGEDFVDKLNAELAAADLMIVVISKTWVDALKARQDSSPEDFVELEVSTALRRRIPILPVRVQSAPPPTALELPGSMKGLATIQSIELRHERYDDDVAFLIGRLRDLLGLPSTSPLPADQSARLTMLLAHLERLRTAGSWATTLLWAAAVVATLAIVDPAARITRQVSPEVADAVTRLNLRPDEAFPGRAASIVAAAPARRGLPDRALQPEARIAGDPRLAAQELSGKVGGFAASAWSFLPDASLRTTSIIAGLAGSVLPASAIGIVLFVRLKGLGLTTDLITWLQSRTATSTRPAGSLARPAPASHVFDAIRRGALHGRPRHSNHGSAACDSTRSPT
jgi:hypothetical protein